MTKASQETGEPEGLSAEASAQVGASGARLELGHGLHLHSRRQDAFLGIGAASVLPLAGREFDDPAAERLAALGVAHGPDCLRC